MSLFLWCQKPRAFRAAKEDSLRYEIGIEGGILHISGIGYCGIKAVIRLREEFRNRDFKQADPDQVVKGLVDVTEMVRGIIEAGNLVTDLDHEVLLEAIHRVIHSQKAAHGAGPDDQSEFLAQPREVELSQRLGISVGLLRLRVFDKLIFLTDESAVHGDAVRPHRETFLPEQEANKTLEGAQSLPNLPPFLAVAVSISPYIDLYRFLYLALLDHHDRDYFYTDKGNLGAVFHGLSGSDVVAIWRGCPSPIILKRVETEGKTLYRLHGPAYVEGIMIGEVWVEDTNELQTFEVT